MLTEATAKIGTAPETAVGGNLSDGTLRIIDKNLGCIVQTQLQDIAGNLGVSAALSEDGAHTLLGKLEAIHDSLAFEAGVEVEAVTHDYFVDVPEELLVGERIKVVGGDGRVK